METSHHSLTCRDRPLSLEITEKEIDNMPRGQGWKYRYPRHIPQFPTRSHRTAIAPKSRSLPTTCQLTLSSTEAVPKLVNDANLWYYKSSDREAKEVHWENIRQNLERRLQAATANQDRSLINLLKQESQQLEMNV
jgi:hypothetical protein